MTTAASVLLLVTGVLALWGKRWAYFAFVAIGALWIPARTGFRLFRPACEISITPTEAVQSLTNWPHLVLFGLFFVLTAVQLGGERLARLGRAFAITLLFGVLIELEQGATRTGNCELHDLIPDAVGALFGAAIMARWYGPALTTREQRSEQGR